MPLMPAARSFISPHSCEVVKTRVFHALLEREPQKLVCLGQPFHPREKLPLQSCKAFSGWAKAASRKGSTKWATLWGAADG